MVDLVLTTAALHGDAALWQRFHDHARTVEDRRDRQRLLGALASFRDPALVERGLGVVIAGEFDIREASRLLYGGLDVPRTRRLVYDFVKDNYDRLLALFPEDSGTSLVQAGSAQCDATLQKEITAFFEPRMNALSGGPRAFAQAMERMDLCIKRRDAQRASVDKFLARW
jgi:alanyl aminopeptidase